MEDEITTLFYELNPWWSRPFDANGLFRRKKYLDNLQKFLDIPHILVLAGPRRAGKTSLLKIIIADLINRSGKDPMDVLYLSFDDPVLGSRVSDKNIFADVFSQYEFIRKKPLDKNIVIFIDEIQAVPGWQVWIKKYYDQRQYKFIISGSSASLIRDKFTELTGRSISVEVYPFDFGEFSEFKSSVPLAPIEEFNFKEINRFRDSMLPREREIKIYFEEFKEKGGYPEIVVKKQNGVYETILKNYFDQIIYRDIVRLHSVKEVSVLENIALYLMQNISQKFSFRNIARSVDANAEIVRIFMQYFVQSYLFFVVGYYGVSLKTTLRKMKKIYFLDTGLRHSIVGHKGLDAGMVVENVVFHSLRGNFERVWYWYDKNKYELDFVVKNKDGVTPIEVKYADHKLEPKELKGLFSFLDKNNLKDGFVITRDRFGKEDVGGKSIIYIPAWLFCLLRLKK